MSEYYAVIRSSSDELKHYGVMGMKWGVRKALHKGSDKAMSKQFAKAQKKIQKYKDKMDVVKQKNEMAYHRGKAIRSAIAAPALFGGAQLGSRWAYDAAMRAPSVVTNPKPGLYIEKVQPTFENYASAATTGAAFLGSIGAAGKAGYHTGKAIAAKYRTTEKGHKKAVAKYSKKIENFQKEMNSVLKGTKYDASRGSLKKKRG